MALYILATRIPGGSLHTPETFETLERQVMNRIRDQCPEVRWLHNFATCGPYDYLDILDAPSMEAAMTVSVLVRTHGHAETQLWPALGWTDFKKILKQLPRGEEARPAVDIEE